MTLHAPNNRYVNDDQVAQAVAQMLARVGIADPGARPMPSSVYFGKARAGEFAFAMLGWGSFSGDLALRALLATPECRQGLRRLELGRTTRIRSWMRCSSRHFATVDDKKREALAREATTLAMKDVPSSCCTTSSRPGR